MKLIDVIEIKISIIKALLYLNLTSRKHVRKWNCDQLLAHIEITNSPYTFHRTLVDIEFQTHLNNKKTMTPPNISTVTTHYYLFTDFACYWLT